MAEERIVSMNSIRTRILKGLGEADSGGGGGVSMNSIRTRILKGRRARWAKLHEWGFNEFDPNEDTERRSTAPGLAGRSRFQ